MSQMRGTTILWGQFMVALTGGMVSLQAATQFVAHQLGYQAALGDPATRLLGIPVYWPWKYWAWLYQYDYYARTVFFQGSLVVYGGVFIVFMVIVFMSVNRARRNKNPDTYGTARWATGKDLQKAGLLGDEGIVLAQTHDGKHQLLRHSGPEHCFVFAPTRSGKGVGIVIPTLLSWRGSVLVYDMKRENWNITAGWRSRFSHVLRFEPTAPFSVRFNPLLEVRKGENEVRDVQNIADILVDPDGSKDHMDHWEKTGHSLLVGVILHVLYAEPDKSLTGVARFLSDPDRTFFKTLQYMLRCRHLGGQVHPVVASVARELLNKSENELSGVLSTAMSFLGLYRDPVISRNTAVSDFTITDLMNANSPVSLYIVIPPSDAERTKPLVRLMLNQIGRRLTESMDGVAKAAVPDRMGDRGYQAAKDRPHRHKLLMLLDEFPTLGRLTFFESELAYMAGYGIQALMIAQSLNQVEKAYGPNNSILDNSHVRITYGTLDDRTAKRISEMLGTATENRRQTNYAGHRLAPWLGHVMVSEQESPRPLLTPGEVLQFPADEALVMVGGNPPYRGLKVRYYGDSRFMDRARLPKPDAPEWQRKELQGLGCKSIWSGSPRPAVAAASGHDASDGDGDATGFAGGVMLEGELQHNPEWGLSVDDRQQAERPTPKRELDDGHQDAEKKKMRDQVEQQRATRNRLLGRQRTIEQSRQPSGGGMPL